MRKVVLHRCSGGVVKAVGKRLEVVQDRGEDNFWELPGVDPGWP